MTTYEITRRIQAKNRDRYMRRLALPNERRSWALFAWATAGIVAASALLWMLA